MAISGTLLTAHTTIRNQFGSVKEITGSDEFTVAPWGMRFRVRWRYDSGFECKARWVTECCGAPIKASGSTGWCSTCENDVLFLAPDASPLPDGLSGYMPLLRVGFPDEFDLTEFAAVAFEKSTLFTSYDWVVNESEFVATLGSLFDRYIPLRTLGADWPKNAHASRIVTAMHRELARTRGHKVSTLKNVR